VPFAREVCHAPTRFDNLYGKWEGVNGLPDAPRARTTQVNQAGAPYQCLLQNDVNLTSPPLSVRARPGR
jgi:phospholipase C